MNIMNIYFFIFLIRKCLNYIVYPIKSYDEFDKIDNLLSFNSTYTTLEMGTPPQKVNFYFSLNHSKMFITDIGCKDTNLFDIDDSSSLFILGEGDNEDPYSSTIIAMDSLHFFDNINLTEEIEMEEYPLYYSVDINKEQKYLCGNIGLSIMQYETFEDEPEELEYYLTFLRSQNNYFSFFNYKGEDFIINSIFLHQEFKDIFQDVENISWVNPIMRNNFLHWEISMKDIYYNKIHFKDNVIFELNPLFELIIGNNDYKKNIKKDYFDFYINKKICLIKEIKGYQIFECDINKFTIKDIKKFPNLYMFNSDLNHVFEMNGEELFNELNNKIYFKIIFPIKIEDNKWIMGKIFLRKYPTIFSPSNRLIGFYIHKNGGMISGNLEEEDESIINNTNKSTKNASFYILIVIIALVFTCCGLFIGRKLFFLRRKKINELIDDFYQYDSKQNKENHKKEENKVGKTFSSIEMKSKI